MATSKSPGGKKRVRPRCRICDKPIRVPKGWTQGPAVRKHYWAQHREVMSGRAGSGKGKKSARGRAAKGGSATRKKGRS